MPGELLLQGDMFCVHGSNHWLATLRYGSVLVAGDGTYRRKIEQVHDYHRHVEPVLTYPEIPDGYRLLVEGEEPQMGDQYAGPSYSSWYLIFNKWNLAAAKTSNNISARKIKQVLIANHYDELSICPDHEIPAGSRRVALNEKGEVIPCTH